MGNTEPENMRDFINRTSREAILELLVTSDADADDFYTLMMKLNEVPYLSQAEVDLSRETDAIIAISTCYDIPKADETIGEKVGVGDAARTYRQGDAEKVFADITEKTGYQFTEIGIVHDGVTLAAKALLKRSDANDPADEFTEMLVRLI